MKLDYICIDDLEDVY